MRQTALTLAALLLAAPAGAQEAGRRYGGDPTVQQLASIAVPPAPRGAADPSFRLHNTGSRTVSGVYVFASGNRRSGESRLGTELMPPGFGIIVRLPAGQCVNDMLLVFANGQTQLRRQVDTCATADVLVQ